MNRLWNLPAWLELPKAAEYLQANTNQKITDLSILEAALEGQVQLSVRFAHSVFASTVPEQPTSTDCLEYEYLSGVYDLVLEGSVRDEIEYWCAVEQDRPYKKLVVHEGARVKREGRVYKLSPSQSPVSALDGGVLGLTREELGDLWTVMRQREPSKEGAQQADIRPLEKQERETLLKIIVALADRFAKDIKSHPPQTNEPYSSTAEEVFVTLSDALGGRVDRKTFRAIIAALTECTQFDLSKPYPAAEKLNRSLKALGLKERACETLVKGLKPIKAPRETPSV